MTMTHTTTTTTTATPGAGNPPPARTTTSIEAVGFRAQISGASLWDLVQMECLSRSRQVIRVSGEGGVGYLYFADGRVVHAVTSRLIGEVAALEILSWTHGLFQPCERAWPATGSIETSCEGLILRLAKKRDEAASNLVAFPARAAGNGAGASAASSQDHEFEEIEIEELHEEGEMRAPTNVDQPTPPPTIGARADLNGARGDLSNARADLTADFPVMLRLGAGGAIIKNKGGDDELAGVVAYAHRLCQLAGELLGLEQFVALECTFTEGRLLIFDEDNGDTVALRPRADTNLQPLRDRLGL
jgi:uncharacterized protein DUF4388